jgi:hypothetical protein
MVEEKRNDGALIFYQFVSQGIPHATEGQNDGNFSQILRCLSITTDASSSSSHFGGTAPFKVQVNFDIPVFEGQIDADALEKWLNLLEGYFSVHNFL